MAYYNIIYIFIKCFYEYLGLLLHVKIFMNQKIIYHILINFLYIMAFHLIGILRIYLVILAFHY